MSIGILPIGQSNSISDGVVLKKFMEYECVAIAQGNFIKFFKLAEYKLYPETAFKIFGEVSNLLEIPLSQTKKSSLLILFTDGRFSIIDYRSPDFKTHQTGHFSSPISSRLSSPYKITQSDHGIFIQHTPTSIQYLEVNKDNFLTNPSNIQIPCLYIHDFAFIQTTSTNIKFIILLETIDRKKEMKFFTLDLKTHLFDETSAISIDNDAYKIFPIQQQSILVFTTNKLIICKEKTTEATTATIYTSDPISKIIQLTEETFIAIDYKGNTYSLYLPAHGAPSWLRVGQANDPVHLSLIDDKTCLSFSKYGSSHIIHMISYKKADITEAYHTSTGPKKIIPVDPLQESDLISISDDGTLNFIRKSIPIRENIKIAINSCYKAWFLDQSHLLLSYDDSSSIISFSTRNLENVSDNKIIRNEKTISFTRYDETFVQLTPSFINYGGKRIKHGDKLICSYLSSNYIATYLNNGLFNAYLISDRKPYFSKKIFHNDLIPNKIACSANYVACSYWPTQEVVLTNIKDLKTVTFNYKGVDIAFDSDENLYVLEEKNKIRKLIINKEETQIIHCESSHSSFIPLDDSIIIAGNYPCLILGDSLYSIDISQSIYHADILGTQILYMIDSYIVIGQTLPKRTSVLQRFPIVPGIYDCTNLSNGQYCITYVKQPTQDTEDPTYYIASVDSPLDLPENPLQVEGKISSMVGFSIEKKCLVAFSINDSIHICECEDDVLKYRHKQISRKGKCPFHLEYFNDYLLVGYHDELDLFSIECVSANDVQLHRIDARQILDGFGEIKAIATYKNQIAVGDSLESIIVYKLKKGTSSSPPKFVEVGRNLDKIFVSQIAFVEGNIFVGDCCGNIFNMEFTGSRNYLTKDIARTNSFHVGSQITAMYSCHLTARVFFGTDSCSHFLITPINDDRLSILIDTATPILRSIGNSNPKMMVAVIEKCIQHPNSFKNLGILQEFETMKKSEIELIAKECEMDPSEIMMLINYCFETN